MKVKDFISPMQQNLELKIYNSQTLVYQGLSYDIDSDDVESREIELFWIDDDLSILIQVK